MAMARHPTLRRASARAGAPTAKVGWRVGKTVAKRKARGQTERLVAAGRMAGSYGARHLDETRDHADRVVASVTVLEALEGLSEDHRGVLDQLYFQGRSLGETASVLGIPTGTVKSRTYYALQALRRSLNRDGVLNVNVVNEGGVTA